MHARVLRARRVESTLALSHRFILPSAHKTNAGTREASISRFNGWPTCSPANASRTASLLPAHDSGSMWIATPSLQWTFTICSLPVSTGARCSDPFQGTLDIGDAFALQQRDFRDCPVTRNPAKTGLFIWRNSSCLHDKIALNCAAIGGSVVPDASIERSVKARDNDTRQKVAPQTRHAISQIDLPVATQRNAGA